MKSKIILSIIPLVCLYFSSVLEVEAQLPWGDLLDEDDNSTSDEEFISKFDELGKAIICKAMSNDSDPEGVKLNLNRPMSLEEVTYLTFLNKARNLRSNSLTFPADLTWRRKLINKIYGLFTYSCPDKFVPHGYVNLLRELIMVYYNSISERETNNTEVWTAFLETLDSCANNKDRMKYEYASSGLHITGLVFEKKKSEAEALVGPLPSDVGEGGDEKMKGKDARDTDSDEGGVDGRKDGDPKVKLGLSIARQQESADALPLDLIIEVLWLVFSHSWATCLPEQESKELWGPRYKQMFYREFLAPLEDRWKNYSPLMDELQIIAGDYDVKLIHSNLPTCTETAYAINDLEQLQLVRPIRMAEVSAGVARFQNRKLGK